jgi:2'-5' RNA ligase
MAFLGIRVPIETARLLKEIDVPGENTANSEMHITLLCFEDNWPISELAKSLEAAYDIVSKIKPFRVTMNKVTCFPKRGDKCAIIAPVKSAELHELRDKLAKSFDKEKIEFSKLFKDFKPHVTLSFNDEEIKERKIDEVEFVVQEVVLWGGDHGDDRIFITFPLKGPGKNKYSFLDQKLDTFYKLAKKPDILHTIPSIERRKVER